MYLGWNFCEMVSRSNRKEIFEAGFSALSNNAICLRIESLIITLEGEKLNTAPGEDGAGLLQLTAQHNCAALMLFAWQSFAFFLQHSIADIPFSALPEKTDVPASTPEASAKSRNRDVSHFFIISFTILNKSKHCQVYSISIVFFVWFIFLYLYRFECHRSG